MGRQGADALVLGADDVGGLLRHGAAVREIAALYDGFRLTTTCAPARARGSAPLLPGSAGTSASGDARTSRSCRAKFPP